MKRVFQHPPEQPSLTGRKYWRSLGELHDTPEFRGWLEREFPAGAQEMEMDGTSRRQFLKLMGASMALAGFGLSGCRRPEAYLVPYSKPVESVIPGKALFYATSMPRRRGAMPLISTNHDGRPTKLEGNPLHPASNGATDTFAQAAVLDLYDPDRSRRFLLNGQETDAGKFVEFLKAAAGEMKGNGGADVAILFEEKHSPTFQRMRAGVSKAFPGVQFCLYDPLRPFNEDEATRSAFGEGVRLAPRFEKADVVLSLDSDFLHPEEGGIEASRDWANRRRVTKAEDGVNRLYVAEAVFTNTHPRRDGRPPPARSRRPGRRARRGPGAAPRGRRGGRSLGRPAREHPERGGTGRPVRGSGQVAGRGRRRPRRVEGQVPRRRRPAAAGGRAPAGPRGERGPGAPRAHGRRP